MLEKPAALRVTRADLEGQFASLFDDYIGWPKLNIHRIDLLAFDRLDIARKILSPRQPWSVLGMTLINFAKAHTEPALADRNIVS